MLSSNDTANLISNLRRNRVVLFLGAGFSRDATNFKGDRLPLAADVAEALWPLAGFPGAYDGTELRFMYDAARNKAGDANVRMLLRDMLTVKNYPDWYRLLPRWFWYRVPASSHRRWPCAEDSQWGTVGAEASLASRSTLVPI
jgi:hypothetical protein